MNTRLNSMIFMIGLLAVTALLGAQAPALPSSNPLAVGEAAIEAAIRKEHWKLFDDNGITKTKVQRLCALLVDCKVTSAYELEFALKYLDCRKDVFDQCHFLNLKNALQLGNMCSLSCPQAMEIVEKNPGINFSDPLAAQHVVDTYFGRGQPPPANNQPVAVAAPKPLPSSSDLSFRVKASWWQEQMSRYGVAYIAGAAALGLLVGSLITYALCEKDS